MKPVLIDVLKHVAFKAGIISSYSDTIPADRKTELIELVQEVREEAAAKAGLSSLILDNPFYLKIEGRYTTGTVTIAQGGITAVGNGTVITAEMVGRKVRIGADPTIYVIASRVNATDFTINRPFLGTTETAGGIEILQDLYDLPADVLSIINLKDSKNSVLVTERQAKYVHIAWPNPFEFTGNVVVYGKQGSRQTTEAITVSAATTTTITATTPTGNFDDYYKGWNLYNVTRGETREITAFSVATGLITIDSEISGQVSTDTIILKNGTQRIIVRNGPTSAVYLEGIGLRPPTKLVNDNDVDYEIPEEYANRLLKVGVFYRYCITGKVPDGINFESLQTEYNGILEDLAASEAKIENRNYQFGQGRQQTELNPISGSGWPAYPDAR